MAKVQEAKSLIQAHKTITAAWKTLKQFIPLTLSGELDKQESWGNVLKECENLAAIGETPAAQELGKDIAIAIYKYLDNVRQDEKANKKEKQDTSRPA